MNADELERSLINLLRRWDAQDFGRIQPARNKPVDLTTARSADDPLEVPIQGEYMFADDDTTGKIYVRFGDKDSHRFPVQTGFTISNIDFKRVYLDWPAQTGKAVNLVYGVGARVAPPNIIGNISQIGSIASPVDVRSNIVGPALAGNAFASSDNQAGVASNYGQIFLVNFSTTHRCIVTAMGPAHQGSTFLALARISGTAAAVTSVLSAGSFAWAAHVNQGQSANARIYTGAHTSLIGNEFHRNRTTGVQEVEFLSNGNVVILPPDSAVGIAASAVNTAMGANFMWYEEPL